MQRSTIVTSLSFRISFAGLGKRFVCEHGDECVDGGISVSNSREAFCRGCFGR